MRALILLTLALVSLTACDGGNVKSAKDYSPPRPPHSSATRSMTPTPPTARPTLTWQPPTFNRDGTIVKPAEPSSQSDRPNYEFAPWATGASGGSQNAPPGTF